MNKLKAILAQILVTLIFLFVGVLNEFLLRKALMGEIKLSAVSIIFLSFILPVLFALSRDLDLLEKLVTIEFGVSIRKAFKESFPYWSSFSILLVSVRLVIEINYLLGLGLGSGLISAVIGLNYASVILLSLFVNQKELEDKTFEKFDRIMSLVE